MKAIGYLVGHLGIDGGSLDAAVAEQFLDDPDVFTVFQQMSGKGVTKGMRRGGFVYSALSECLLECPLQRIRLDMTFIVGKQKSRLVDPAAAIVPQKFQRAIGKMDIAVFASLAVAHPQKMPSSSFHK